MSDAIRAAGSRLLDAIASDLTTSPTEPADVSFQTAFEIVKNERRRVALRYLADEGSMRLGELATQLARWEIGSGDREPTGQDRKRVYVALQQVHIENMEDAGLIAYYSPTNFISITPDGERLVEAMDRFEGVLEGSR